jgi:hypothetical protein
LDDPQEDELHQVANLVIDAYLSRNDNFVPTFDADAEAVMYLAHGDAEEGSQSDVKRKTPKLNFWYQRSDYEDERDQTLEKESEGAR